MDIKEQSTPILPLELIERMVDFAGQESTKTCMLVSRQFYAGAIRNVYRHQFLDLKAHCDVLSKKYSRLFGDQEDQSLLGGSRGRHVRKLSVKVGAWPRYWDKNVPEYEEDILLQLLEALSKRTGLQELHVHGGGRGYQWDSLPRKVREGLRALIWSPNLSTLSIQEFYNFPADILHGNKTLRLVKLTDCENVTNASGHAVMLPKATSLSSHHLGSVENGFILPHLQLLTAHHSTAEEGQASWTRMAHAREALRRISMVDDENATTSHPHHIITPALPGNLKLSNFPKLWYLSYAYEGESWNRADSAPLLCDIIPFFEVATPVPEFNALRLHLSLDQSNHALGEEFWMERKDMVATDPSWATLDTILASDLYPEFEEVYIGLKIFNWMLEELDSEIIRDAYPHYTGDKEALAEDIKNIVLGHFVRCKARGIDVVVEVCANF